MRAHSVIAILSLAAVTSAASVFAQTANPSPAPEPARLTSDAERTALHNSAEWQMLQPHRPRYKRLLLYRPQ